MQKVQIITDSSAYLPQPYVDEYKIEVVPLLLNWKGKSYRDGIDITAGDFYRRLKDSDEIPTTSQSTVHDYKLQIQKALDHHLEPLILPISSGISASVKSAFAAKEEFPGKPVEVLDTRLVSMALSFMVLAAARAAKAGKSLAECKAIAEEAYKHIGVYFVVDTLKYLYKGGRIGGAKRLLGAALKIKPILQIRDGAIEAAASSITRKKALEHMVDMVKEAIGTKKPVRLSVFHALEPEISAELLERLKLELNAEEAILSEVSPVVGAHVGPGTISIAWMAGM